MTKTKKSRTAIVYYGKDRAGRLVKNPDGPNTGYGFEYEASYIEKPGARPISLGMPLQREKYHSKTLFPFFEGLLPEGWLLESGFVVYLAFRGFPRSPLE